MGILRLFAVTVGKITTFRCYQILLVLGAALAVMAFYYFGSENQNFSSTTKRIKQQTRASNNSSRNDADLSADTASVNHEGKSGVVSEAADRQERRGDRRYYHVLMMFTKIDKSRTLQSKFEVAMRSMSKHGHFLEDEVLVLHYVSDAASKGLGEKMLPELMMNATFRHEVVFHDVDVLTEKLFPIVEAMQKHFSAGSGTYYSDSIFFLSVAMHRILPEEMKRVVQLDLDLKFRSNIRDLFQEFEHFPPETVIGIVREMQPVYRHTFWQYRKERPHSGVGDPPPQGLSGFNSGVMLLDLHAMRHSALYNQLLEPGQVARLAERYHFHGHLGDQDFFTMIGMERPELFHLLPCGWNRQLCTWWRDHGYADVFQLYYRCDGPVHIYHGNCNTPIPDD